MKTLNDRQRTELRDTLSAIGAESDPPRPFQSLEDLSPVPGQASTRVRLVALAAAALLIVGTATGLWALTTSRHDQRPTTDSVWPADRLTEGWNRLPAPPLSPRVRPRIRWSEHVLVVTAGQTQRCPSGPGCDYTADARDGAIFSPSSWSWTKIEPAPMNIDEWPAAIYKDSLYLCGDRLDDIQAGEPVLLRYSISDGVWAEVGPVDDCSWPTVIDGHYLRIPRNDKQVLDLDTQRWVAPRPPCGGTEPDFGLLVNDRCLVFHNITPDHDRATYRVTAYDRSGKQLARNEMRDIPTRVGNHWLAEEDAALEFDPITLTWHRAPDSPNGDTVSVGAVTASESTALSPNSWAYDYAESRWIKVSPQPALGACTVCGRAEAGRNLVTIGGSLDQPMTDQAWIWVPPGGPNPESQSAGSAPGT